MRAHKRVELTREQGKKYVKYDEGAALYSMGLNTFQRLVKETQATVRVGRSVWVNLDLFEKYFQTFAEF